MNGFERYFAILLTSARYSVAEIITFATDHEARLVANNPGGIFDERVAATATALDEATDSTGREATAEAVQKARTSTKRRKRQQINDTVSQQSGFVSAKFGKDSPEYLEFFPRGLTEFHTARESEVAELLQRLVDAATAHLPELLPIFEQLADEWHSASGEAATRRAARSVTANERGDALQALRVELTKNLLTLALHFLGQPEKAKVYFQPSLLENRTRSQADGAGDPDNAEPTDEPLHTD